MKRSILIFIAFVCLFSDWAEAQPTPTFASYAEMSDSIAPNLDAWRNGKGIKVSWGSTDVRYAKEAPMDISKAQKKIKLNAWRGERVAAQWVVSNYADPATISYEVSDFVHAKNKNQVIDHSALLTGFVRYVMTDELNKDGNGTCGYRKSVDFDSSLSADAIDPYAKELDVASHNSQAGWVRIWVPESAAPGNYSGKVTIFANDKAIGKLDLTLQVSDKILPSPDKWTFHLDLWQNPYAVARIHNVAPWSKEHFDYLKMEMANYANAGGKVITASIMHRPWNGQTYDFFESMVTWMKKADGTWWYDYTVFDKWVEFMMSMGVDKQINCYSMVPWRLSFQYFDQATNQLQNMQAKPGDPAYEEFWISMLTSFAAHLKEKGWFDKTMIAMDERPLKVMNATIEVIRKADKDFKIALAGDWHEELSAEMNDYCIPYREDFPAAELAKRKVNGQVSTIYTSCSGAFPNAFTFSHPAESEWIGWHVAAKGLDGFLRWAYNSWVENPLQDSRFITWGGGDTYQVYPDGRTSLRFEKLVDGIQQFEKIRLIQKNLTESGAQAKLKKLNEILSRFEELNSGDEAAAIIQKARKDMEAL